MQRGGGAHVVAQARHTRELHVREDETPIRRARLFVLVVHQRQQIDVVTPRELTRDVVRADPIAAVRRVRQPMREEQDSHAMLARAIGASRRFTTRAGTPAATTRSGTGRVTTAPAPTIESRPTSAMTMAAVPIQAPAPMRTRDGEPG